MTPVDRDRDGALLAQTIAGRGDTTIGRKSAEFFGQYPFRDSIGSDGGLIWESRFAIYPFVDFPITLSQKLSPLGE